MLIILPFGIISLSNKPGVILTPWYHSRVKCRVQGHNKRAYRCFHPTIPIVRSARHVFEILRCELPSELYPRLSNAKRTLSTELQLVYHSGQDNNVITEVLTFFDFALNVGFCQ